MKCHNNRTDPFRQEKRERVFHREVTDPWPCKDYQDFPGASFPMNLPDFSYSLRYTLKVTFECENEDRSAKISDTVNIDALFIGTYPPPWKL